MAAAGLTVGSADIPVEISDLWTSDRPEEFVEDPLLERLRARFSKAELQQIALAAGS